MAERTHQKQNPPRAMADRQETQENGRVAVRPGWTVNGVVETAANSKNALHSERAYGRQRHQTARNTRQITEA